MKDELKPCPWCGRKPKIKDRAKEKSGSRHWNVSCGFFGEDDHHVCDVWGTSKEDAIKKWNTRHVDLEGLLSVDELTEIIESVAKVYHIEHHRFPCPQEFASEIYRAQQKKMNSQPPSGTT